MPDHVPSKCRRGSSKTSQSTEPTKSISYMSLEHSWLLHHRVPNELLFKPRILPWAALLRIKLLGAAPKKSSTQVWLAKGMAVAMGCCGVNVQIILQIQLEPSRARSPSMDLQHPLTCCFISLNLVSIVVFPMLVPFGNHTWHCFFHLHVIFPLQPAF